METRHILAATDPKRRRARRAVIAVALALALAMAPAPAGAHHATNADNHSNHYHLHGSHADYYQWISHSTSAGRHHMRWFNHAHLYYYNRSWCVSSPCAV